MSDVESIAYVHAKVAALRGVMSGKTYQAIMVALNTIQGELQSLKTAVGQYQAAIESLTNELSIERSKVENLTGELAAKSTVEVDRAVEKIVDKVDADSSAAEVVNAIENDVANTVPKESLPG